MLGAAAIGTWYFSVTKSALLDPKKLAFSEEKIELFDGDGEKIESAAAYFKDENFHLAELPQKLRYAFVDNEDKRFYSHHGFDYKRIVKATWENIRSRSFKQGASTISQQLIKNTHLSQEKTIQRKLREFKLTRQLEKNYSKDEILERYLNSIYFGHNCFGLRSAARFYFGKEVKELTLSDAAVLSGLIRSPNNYSPFKSPENCLKRKKAVLGAMLKQKHVTKTEMLAALSEPLPEAPTLSNGEKSYFSRVFDELEELSEKHNFTLGGKIRIHTYLNRELQERLSSLSSASETDKIYSVLSVKTGGFKAYYSTVGTPKRSPASLLKPLLVYAPALEEGLVSPATPVLDERVNFGGYEPKNYSGAFLGYVSVRESLSKSLNVPAVKILNSLGTAKAVSYLEKTGLYVPERDRSLALALGGMSDGFSLNELMSAYSVFPLGGERQATGFIREIDVDGIKIYQKQQKRDRAFSSETAYLVSDMLKTAAQSGTAKKLRALPFPVAAKTGTGGVKDGNTDAYTLSFTTEDCVGVWLGNADNSLNPVTGGGLPANIALAVNEFLYADHAPSDFSKPDGVVRAALDKNEYYDRHSMVLADELAPASFRFFEIFAAPFLPATRSEKFTNPSISKPSVQFSGGKVIIRFPDAPEYYAYHIDRYDYVTHNTVYEGGKTDEFIDEDVKKGKRYVYTVTPIYQKQRGKPIVLPAVTTEDNDSGNLIPVVPDAPPIIIDEEWWTY